MQPLAVSGRVVTRAYVEAHIETLIALLDQIDGDPDLEDSDEDHCAAHDDDPAASLAGFGNDWGPGEPDDAEDTDEDRCEAGDDGCGPHLLNGIHWGSEHDEDWEPLNFCDRQAYVHHRNRLRRKHILETNARPY